LVANALLTASLNFAFNPNHITFVSIESKPKYTIQELADYYETTPRTIYNWLTHIRKQLIDMSQGKQRLRILLPKQVKMIKEFWG
jgi:predicted DNA-binding transcriptional regulator YafY